MSAEEPQKKGFFKRLFGRKDAVVEPTPEVVEAPKVAEPKLKAEPKTPAAKKPEAKKATPKKATPKKVTEAKPEAKKPEARKPAVKKTTAKKAVPNKSAAKKAAPAKEAPKKVAKDVSKAPAKKTAPDKKPAAKKPAPEPVVEKPAAPTPTPVVEKPTEKPAEKEEKKKGWFGRLKQGLSRSSNRLSENIAAVFVKKKLDDEMLEELEDILIQSDLGVATAMRITQNLAKDRFDKEVTTQEVRHIMAREIEAILAPVAQPLVLDMTKKPHIVLMVGVNGTGKTTTIGKLAAQYKDDGLDVVLAAGDTFRAAAVEQLQIWGERVGAPVITRPTGSDAAGLVFDACRQAREDGADVLLIDTAGRLQNREELMAELEKIIRVIKKHDESAPHTVLLTLDATVGQNALSQVEIFGQRAGVTGLVMTKLDGTARGGILVAIAEKFKLPVHFLGVGEGYDDLEPFTAADFARAIAGDEEISEIQSDD